MSASESTYAVYWPRGAKTAAVHQLPSRPRTLDGKTVAFLWDYMFRGDEIWAQIKDDLSRRYRDVRFIEYDVFGSTHGEDEHRILAALPARIKELGIDAVVSGMGC